SQRDPRGIDPGMGILVGIINSPGSHGSRQFRVETGVFGDREYIVGHDIDPEVAHMDVLQPLSGEGIANLKVLELQISAGFYVVAAWPGIVPVGVGDIAGNAANGLKDTRPGLSR